MTTTSSLHPSCVGRISISPFKYRPPQLDTRVSRLSSISPLNYQTRFKPSFISLQYSSIAAPKPICLPENPFHKFRAIAHCGGDNWGNGGGGGGTGGDGEGEEEGFEGDKEQPMLRLTWPMGGRPKDQEAEAELEDRFGLQVQLFWFDYDDDMFPTKNAAEDEKGKEKILKEMEIAADVCMAKAIGANVRLFYLPGAVSLTRPIEDNVGSMAKILYACFEKVLEITLAGPSYSFLERLGVKVHNGEKHFAIATSSTRVDVEGDGALKFIFVSFHPGKLANDEILKKAFEFFDLNNSGHIGLKKVLNATTLIF